MKRTPYSAFAFFFKSLFIIFDFYPILFFVFIGCMWCGVIPNNAYLNFIVSHPSSLFLYVIIILYSIVFLSSYHILKWLNQIVNIIFVFFIYFFQNVLFFRFAFPPFCFLFFFSLIRGRGFVILRHEIFQLGDVDRPRFSAYVKKDRWNDYFQ